MTAFVEYFAKLREDGGEADAKVVMKRTATQPGHNLVRYDSIEVFVTLLIPFSFVNKNHICVVEGKDISTTMRTVVGPEELRVLLDDMRYRALGEAVSKANIEIPKLMKEVRPTVSCRKTKRKTRATLRRFGFWNIACSFNKL